MIDLASLRDRVDNLHAAACDQQERIENGTPRFNREFGVWALPDARAVVNELLDYEATPPESAAAALIAATEAFTAVLDIISAVPATTERLMPLLIAIALVMLGCTETLAAPTPNVVAALQAMERRRRQRG